MVLGSERGRSSHFAFSFTEEIEEKLLLRLSIAVTGSREAADGAARAGAREKATRRIMETLEIILIIGVDCFELELLQSDCFGFVWLENED